MLFNKGKRIIADMVTVTVRESAVPFSHPDDGMLLSVAERHDGVTVIVPVDHKLRSDQPARQPGHGDARQPRRILGQRTQA